MIFFPALGHWELSHTITTHHLLSLISITNTLTSVSNASFIPEQVPVPYRRKEEMLEKVSVLHDYLPYSIFFQKLLGRSQILPVMYRPPGFGSVYQIYGSAGRSGKLILVVLTYLYRTK
jgi:hypothetical protein